jgi:hypothetical protein
MTNTKQLNDLKQRMLDKALLVGPLHSWWDFIADIDNAINGRKLDGFKDKDQLIAACEKCLKD